MRGRTPPQHVRGSAPRLGLAPGSSCPAIFGRVSLFRGAVAPGRSGQEAREPTPVASLVLSQGGLGTRRRRRERHAVVSGIYLGPSFRDTLLNTSTERSLRALVLISLHIFSRVTHKDCKLGGAFATLYGRDQASVIAKRVICSEPLIADLGCESGFSAERESLANLVFHSASV